MGGTELLIASLVAGGLAAGGQVYQAQQQNRAISRQRSAAAEAEKINQIQLRSVRQNEQKQLVSNQARQLAAINVLAASSGTLGGEGWQQLIRQNNTDGQTDLASIATNGGRRSLASSTQFQAQDAALASRRVSGLAMGLNAIVSGVQAGASVYSTGSQIAQSNAAADLARQQAGAISTPPATTTGYAGRTAAAPSYGSGYAARVDSSYGSPL